MLMVIVGAMVLTGASAISGFADDATSAAPANNISQDSVNKTGDAVGGLFTGLSFSPLILGVLVLIYTYNKL